MFGRDETLREAIPGYHVDYRERLAHDATARWSDRLTADGTWHPNLFQFYLRATQRLFTDLKIPFQLDSDLFRKGETEVHEAIREALVNSLIHADYNGQGGIVVEKLTDAFEFSNPGTLLISLDQLLRGNISECRNKTLQTMFMLIGAAEKAGSGIDKMRRGWATQHWRLPMLQEQIRPDRVLWRLPMVSLIPEESRNRLIKIFGQQFSKFDKYAVQALVTADIEGSVDNSRMRQICDIHATDVTRLLQGLVAQGALIQEGHARWSRYQLPAAITTNHVSLINSPNSANFLHKPTHSLHNSDHSLHNADHSLHNADHSLHNSNHSLHKPNHSSHNTTNLSDKQELLTIAETARNQRRLPPKQLECILLKLCTGRWLTRQQLADLVGRNSESLRQRFLSPMVNHGLLRLRYPDKPNRVDQSYTANGLVAENDFRLAKQ